MEKISQVKIQIIVFLTSFSILAYEINFTRVFAFTQWHNLSALIITMALLGFGASGSVIAVLQQKFRYDYSRLLFMAARLFPLFLCTGFIASLRLEFNPYEISFSLKQVIHLSLYFLFMGTGFFFGAAVICITFMTNRVSHIYFASLAGSSAGGAGVLCFSFLLHPLILMVPVILMSLVPLCLLSSRAAQRMKMETAGIVCLTIAALSLSLQFLNPGQVSQYKPVSGALNLPDAKIIHEAYSPLGVVQVVEAEGLRSTTGLSLASPYQIPVQKAIFFDGEGISPITPYDGDLEKISYVQYLSSFLPFYISSGQHRERVLIVGPGGGESILRSVLAGFEKIDAIEANQNVIDLMKKPLARFSGNIYNLDNIQVINQEARHFIRQTKQRYDLIEFSMVDAYNAAASGVYALNETYLYTVESIREMVDHLSDAGLLAITRWVVTPPRDNLKLFNMVITALKETGVKRPGDHLIAIRSLQTLTLIVSKRAVTENMIDRTGSFSTERLFDLVYYPGIRKPQTNQFIRMKTPVYYQGMKNLLSNESETFIDQYDFDIRSATDNRPYFYNFFKPGVADLIIQYGISQIPVTEWGYLLLLIILVPVFIISALFILGPLLVLKDRPERMDLAATGYFSLIGVGFFFIEMPLIQQMILFLGHPAYAVSIVICSLLFFSGVGSWFSDRLFSPGRRILISTVLIAGITGIYLAGLPAVFQKLHIHWFAVRCLIVISLLAPLGFFMGIPFPAGLNLIKDRSVHQVPLAWGINGFFSVISILMAVLLAVVFGFSTVFILSICFYLSAGIIAHKYMHHPL